MGCTIDYYTKKKWKVLSSPPPVGETPDHIIVFNLKGENLVDVVCLNGHASYQGVFDSAQCLIVGPPENPTWKIEPQMAAPPGNLIARSPLVAGPDDGATWTAQDAGTRG